MSDGNDYIAWFESLGRTDVPRVGGKNASLGEMVQRLRSAGVRVPTGFAATAEAYWTFVNANALGDVIRTVLGEMRAGHATLAEAGHTIRRAFLRAKIPEPLADALRGAYRELSARIGAGTADVAVRSSATAEDLPEASFAGQQESFLNIVGEDALLDACRKCYASLFTDRAISYRDTHGFDHLKVALSIGVQRMVRSDRGCAGVMFSLDTETGFDKVVLINGSWGLGESIVQGRVDPDEYHVYKPLLDDPQLVPIIEKQLGTKAVKLIYDAAGGTREVPTSVVERAAYALQDAEILQLARWACAIERHYGLPMDMEWARDGLSGELFIVQARPETVQSRREAGVFRTYTLKNKGPLLLKGLAIGDAVAAGRVCIIRDARDLGRFVDGAVLVTGTTDPDWVPIMKRAKAIVTDHGGRTSHAAIVSRELGLPAIVGTGNATELLHDGQDITVSCAEGDEGAIYEGIAGIETQELSVEQLPRTETQVMLNLANPAAAYRWWRLPADGVGLLRMEFVIANQIKAHPMALLRFDTLKDVQARDEIAALTRGYADKAEYFVDRLARGLSRIAAVYYPKPVIVRFSDFKTNEYARLLGGAEFEPHEENPMIGFRGASRYYAPAYRDGFALECRAIRRLRERMGFDNVIVMIPFCRSVREADRVLEVMAAEGLKRGAQNDPKGLQVYVMCEIPSNVILADKFAQRFDGFSIGSNDLTQLTLGVDRDSESLAGLFDEQDEAVKAMIESVITNAHGAHAKVGLCGQAPSDHPEFAEFLVDCGIDSISVTPDSFLAVKRRVAEAESRQRRPPAAPGAKM
ncbi:MAG: phosphoenolpyruvate synthase [Sinimarinibacterium sp.]|jgi:pyruvate,water dikinase